MSKKAAVLAGAATPRHASRSASWTGTNAGHGVPHAASARARALTSVAASSCVG